MLTSEFDATSQTWVRKEIMPGVAAPTFPNSAHLHREKEALKSKMHFVYTPETKVATMDLQTCLAEALETTIKMRRAQGLPVDLSKPIVVCFKADSASIGMLFLRNEFNLACATFTC
jgi:hypothetical protein